jgi:hypothetical protein
MTIKAKTFGIVTIHPERIYFERDTIFRGHEFTTGNKVTIKGLEEFEFGISRGLGDECGKFVITELKTGRTLYANLYKHRSIAASQVSDNILRDGIEHVRQVINEANKENQ